jgi:hypothetical protein
MDFGGSDIGDRFLGKGADFEIDRGINSASGTRFERHRGRSVGVTIDILRRGVSFLKAMGGSAAGGRECGHAVALRQERKVVGDGCNRAFTAAPDKVPDKWTDGSGKIAFFGGDKCAIDAHESQRKGDESHDARMRQARKRCASKTNGRDSIVFDGVSKITDLSVARINGNDLLQVSQKTKATRGGAGNIDVRNVTGEAVFVEWRGEGGAKASISHDIGQKVG